MNIRTPAFPTFPKELKKKKKDNPLLFYLLCRKYRDIIDTDKKGNKYGRKQNIGNRTTIAI